MNETGFLEITAGGDENEPDHVVQSPPWRLQARLEWQEDGLTITDLGGRQPLLINNVPLEPNRPTTLKAGDRIVLAGVQMVWRPPKSSFVSRDGAEEFNRYSLIINTPGWTREVPIQGSALNVGRAEDNDIIINNEGISRHHAGLEQRGDSYEIFDQGSTYGLRFQGQAISRKSLANGDDIQIADEVILTFRVVGEGVDQPAEVQPVKAGLGATVLVPRDKSRVERDESTPASAGAPADIVPSDYEQSNPAQQPPRAGKTIIISGKKPSSLPVGAKGPSHGQTSMVDMEPYLEEFGDAAPAFTGLWETPVPHIVIHIAGKTWQALFTKEHMSIGRDEENDIVIPDSSVSKRHATIDRKRDAFTIRDAGSGNGIWLGKQRIESRQLRSGDTVSIGRAKIVFKGGFKPNDLTLIGPPTINGKRARRPVVFVPGMGGSELWLGSEKLYPVPKILLSNPEVLGLPGDPRIEARQIVSDIVIIPGVLKQAQYSRLGDYLENGLGYTRGKDLLEFAYDWRQDIRLAAQRLAEAIEQWRPRSPVTIIGHSLGSLVTRYYVEKLGGKRQTERIILMGGPQYGTPKAINLILVGPDVLPFGIGDERLRQVMAQYPSSYQILPTYPSVFDQEGRQIEVLEDDSWLPESQRPFLRSARSFRRELGFRSSVPCVSIFGYGFKTSVRVHIERRPNGGWQKVSYVDEIAGDLSVPAGSAVLKNSEIHPVNQEHGALYVDNDVKMRLKVELTRSTTLEGKKI